MLVGFPPGGSLDFTSRLGSSYMTKELGQPIVVENKPGVAGVIALSELARSAPDVYTLVVGNVGPLALAPHMMDKPPYNPSSRSRRWARCSPPVLYSRFRPPILRIPFLNSSLGQKPREATSASRLAERDRLRT
jgi:hypothetical protein